MKIEDLAEDLKTVESVLEAVTDELSALRARIEALENRADPLLSLPEAPRTRGEALPASNNERGGEGSRMEHTFLLGETQTGKVMR